MIIVDGRAVSRCMDCPNCVNYYKTSRDKYYLKTSYKCIIYDKDVEVHDCCEK